MSEADDDIDLDECVMIGDTLATKMQINNETVGLSIFKVQSIKDKDNGKVFSGTILEGKVIGNNLSLKTSKVTREEVTVDVVFTVYCKIQNMLLRYLKHQVSWKPYHCMGMVGKRTSFCHTTQH